jgi:hypothetical protein
VGTSAFDRLELDYKQTSDIFKLLADIRFKLLALVPTVAGIGTALVGKKGIDAQVQLSIGLLGFVATSGILIYELRNSELYNWAIHRAKHLERALGLEASALGAAQGGVFGERVPQHWRLLRFVPVKHDPALALVYGSALAAWTWVWLEGLVSLVSDLSARTAFWLAFVGALAMGVLVIWLVGRHDRGQRLPKAVDDRMGLQSAAKELTREIQRALGDSAPEPATARRERNRWARVTRKRRERRKKELDALAARCSRTLMSDATTQFGDDVALRKQLDALRQALDRLEHREDMTPAAMQEVDDGPGT